MPNAPSLSIVICTYNRAELLRQALASVLEQDVASDRFQVIVVDNNSSDDTARVIEEYAAGHANLVGCFESEQGLSHARNRGWRAARSDYVLFLDDDAKAPPGWLDRAQALVDDLRPAAVGGAYHADYDSPKPAWYKDEYGSHVACEQLTRIDGLPDVLHGGNLLIRRELIEQAGGYRSDLGMCGEQPGYGEETALIRAIQARASGAALYFDPDLWVLHLVNAHKMTLDWLLRYRFESGRSGYRMDGADVGELLLPGLLGRALLTSGRLLLTAPVALLLRNRRLYPWYMNWFYEQGSWRLYTLGKLYERFRDLVT